MMSFLILVLAFIAVFCIIVGVGLMVNQGPPKFILEYEKALAIGLQEIFVTSISARQLLWYILFSVAVTFIVILVATASLFASTLVSSAVYYFPLLWFKISKEERRSSFELQLPSTLEALANAAKAGLTLPQAIEDSIKNTPKPTSQELAFIHHEYTLGAEMGETLENARKRINSNFFDLVVTALLVNRDKGGTE